MPRERGEKVVATNRRARHEYAIEKTYEAGLVLTGSEIKSVRARKVNLADAYARIEHGEAWLIGAHIAPFEQANRNNHEPKRARKLLLHRAQIEELLSAQDQDRMTLVATKLYFKGGRVKLELCVARGKKMYDKRETLKRRDADKEARVAIRNARRGD